VSRNPDASFGGATLHAGADAWADCSIYADGHTPILTVHGGDGLRLAIYLRGEQITAGHTRFARDLLHQAERFAAEAERLYSQAQTAHGSEKTADPAV
jgi:hypothetical protein